MQAVGDSYNSGRAAGCWLLGNLEVQGLQGRHTEELSCPQLFSGWFLWSSPSAGGNNKVHS